MIQTEQNDRSVDEDTADSRDVGKFVAGKFNWSEKRGKHVLGVKAGNNYECVGGRLTWACENADWTPGTGSTGWCRRLPATWRWKKHTLRWSRSAAWKRAWQWAQRCSATWLSDSLDSGNLKVQSQGKTKQQVAAWRTGSGRKRWCRLGPLRRTTRFPVATEKREI